MTTLAQPIWQGVAELGQVCLYFVELAKTFWRKKISGHEVLEQIWKVTVQSAPTTALAGFFVGAIMTVQFTMQMKEFGALGFLGGLATSGTIREVGPLLIAFLLAGKIGAFTSAELGTMRVTEQLDAIRCLGADPVQEIILPRFLGIVVASFFLLGLGLVGSVFGGLLLGQIFAGVNPQEYVRYIPDFVHGYSIFCGLFKCLTFSILLATVCTYYGYFASGGARESGERSYGLRL